MASSLISHSTAHLVSTVAAPITRLFPCAPPLLRCRIRCSCRCCSHTPFCFTAAMSQLGLRRGRTMHAKKVVVVVALSLLPLQCPPWDPIEDDDDSSKVCFLSPLLLLPTSSRSEFSSSTNLLLLWRHNVVARVPASSVGICCISICVLFHILCTNVAINTSKI